MNHILLRGWTNNRNIKYSSGLLNFLIRKNVERHQIPNPHKAVLIKAGESYERSLVALLDTPANRALLDEFINDTEHPGGAKISTTLQQDSEYSMEASNRLGAKLEI